MESIPLAVWLPIVTLIIGYGFSLVTEAFRDKRQTRREREARAVEWKAMQEGWREERTNRRKEYDRGTLTQLQDALQEFIAVCGDIYGERMPPPGEKRLPLPEPLRRRYLDAERVLVTLSSRIADEEVRELVTKVKRRSGPVLLAQDFDRADDAFAEVRTFGEQALTRMGELIRGTLA